MGGLPSLFLVHSAPVVRLPRCSQSLYRPASFRPALGRELWESAKLEVDLKKAIQAGYKVPDIPPPIDVVIDPDIKKEFDAKISAHFLPIIDELIENDKTGWPNIGGTAAMKRRNIEQDRQKMLTASEWLLKNIWKEAEKVVEQRRKAEKQLQEENARKLAKENDTRWVALTGGNDLAEAS